MQADLEREDKKDRARQTWGSCKYMCRNDGTCRLKETLTWQDGQKRGKDQNIVECFSQEECSSQTIKCDQCREMCNKMRKYGKETNGTRTFTLRLGTKPNKYRQFFDD